MTASNESTGADDVDGDRHLRETTVRTEQVYRGHFLQVRRDQVELPDGRLAQREYILHPGAVMVVPLLEDGRVVVERQWRHPLARVMLEFPAGKIDVGEPPWQCAIRELREETGYAATEWARAGILHNAIAYSDEGIEIWFARGLVAGTPELDAGEFLDVLTMSVDELDAQAQSGEMTDAKTLIGLLWLQHWRAGRWRLDWHAQAADAAHDAAVGGGAGAAVPGGVVGAVSDNVAGNVPGGIAGPAAGPGAGATAR